MKLLLKSASKLKRQVIDKTAILCKASHLNDVSVLCSEIFSVFLLSSKLVDSFLSWVQCDLSLLSNFIFWLTSADIHPSAELKSSLSWMGFHFPHYHGFAMLFPLPKSFSVMALLTFWAGWFFVLGSCHHLNSSDNQKSRCPLGGKFPLWIISALCFCSLLLFWGVYHLATPTVLQFWLLTHTRFLIS